MLVQQLSVFIENQPGKLEEVAAILGQSGVDITALSLADTAEFGILRLIVDNPGTAQAALRAAGLIVKVTDVLAVAMEDQPGGLASILRQITQAGITIEYMYAFVGKQDGKAVVVMRVSDLDGAAKSLAKDLNATVTARDIYNL